MKVNGKVSVLFLISVFQSGMTSSRDPTRCVMLAVGLCRLAIRVSQFMKKELVATDV